MLNSERDTLPPGSPCPFENAKDSQDPPEVTFARIVGQLLSHELAPVKEDIQLMRESLNAVREEFRGHLRGHDLELKELREDLEKLTHRVKALENG